jgi:predicted amidohydrolase
MGMTISLAQMELAFGDPETNLERVIPWIEEAARRQSDLILFPELWASGYDLERASEYAEPLGEGAFAELSSWARKYHIMIGSSLLERRGEAFYNTFTLYGPGGELRACYRKIHLFRLLKEERWLAAGDRLTLQTLPWGKTGLSICYDLRFPEMYRAYAVGGARLVLLVAEWPQKRIVHWRQLLKARAIENQYFLAAVNKVGSSQGAKLGGHSALLNPMGERVIEGGGEEVLLTATIDLNQVEQVRDWMPVLDDRAPEAYRWEESA